MESVNLEMDDMFDMAAGEDFDQAQSTVAELDGEAEEGPMREEGEDGDNDGPSEDVLAKLKDLKGAAKKRVMRPQPKLDGERIRGERGLTALPKLFENVTFKGKGHEAEDMKRLMGGLQHWAHRLFPKATFDEFIERLEKLGSKREIQTYVKRIRMDLLMDDEFAPLDSDDEAAGGARMEEGDEDPFGAPGISAPRDEFEDLDAEEAYEAMLRAERLKMSASADVTSPNHTPAKPGPSTSSATTPAPATPSTSATTNPGDMTPEMRERLEANKLKALQKRAARLGVSVESLMSPKPSPATPSTSQPTPEPALSDSGINSQDHTSSQQATTSSSSQRKATASATVSAKATTIKDLEINSENLRTSAEKSSLQLQLSPSASDAGDSADSSSKHDSDGLHLRLTETETEMDANEMETDIDTNALQLDLVDDKENSSSVANAESESIHLRLSESVKGDSKRTGSESESGLQLQLEVTEDNESEIVKDSSKKVKSNNNDSLLLQLSETEEDMELDS